MLSEFSPFSRIVAIERDMGDVIPGFWDPFASYLTSLNSFFNPSNFYLKSTKDSMPHVISIVLGHCYNKDDINIIIDENKLKVTGKAVESIRDGSNVHQFEREYLIPDDVNASTMRSKLHRGCLYIAFDKKHIEPKKMLEDLSNDQEFRVRINFNGIKPEECSVKVVGHDLVIEGSSKSSGVSHGDDYRSSSCSYASRTIRLPESVELDKLRAVISDGSLQIFAAKDQSKLRPTDRLLQIENNRDC